MKTCIITLDLINEICHPDGKLARYADRIESNNIIANTNRVIAWGREHDHLIAHVRIGFDKSYKNCSSVSPIFSKASEFKALTLGEWATEFCEELATDENDIFINKHRVSAFYGTDLELVLRANKIEKIILCGVATNNAVELTTREAHDRDFSVVVVTDTTECASDEEQRASLDFMSKIAELTNSKELCTTS